MQDSIWFQTVPAEGRELLGRSDPLPQSADVVIVGAGMIGLLTAYYLTEAGVTNICLVDRSAALAEASGANSGGLWFAQRSLEFEAVPGIARASSRLYDQLASRFEFGFERCGVLQLLYDQQQIEDAAQRAEVTRKTGFRVERVSGDQAQAIEPALGFKPLAALFYPEDGHLHPVKLGLAIIHYLKSRGVRLCLHTEVTSPGPRVETSHGAIAAGNVVIASGSWTPLVTSLLGWEPPIKPVRGTSVALGPLDSTPQRDIVAANFLHWRVAGEYVAAGGTVDNVGFQRGVEPAAVHAVRAEMDQLFPTLAGRPTACAWSGFRPHCEDMKPVVGPVPGCRDIYVAAGHFKKGIVLGPPTGKIMADLITTGETDLPIEALSPARFPPNRQEEPT